MTQKNLATRDDAGIEYAEFEEIKRDTITIPRAEHEHLLWLTTPKSIETAPRDEVVMLKNGRGWREGMVCDDIGWCGIDKFTRWLPLPNTPMPTTSAINQLSDDAQDALDR